MAQFEGAPIAVGNHWMAIEFDGVRHVGKQAITEALAEIPTAQADGVIVEFESGGRTFLGKLLDSRGRSAVQFDDDGEVIL